MTGVTTHAYHVLTPAIKQLRPVSELDAIEQPLWSEDDPEQRFLKERVAHAI